MSSFIASLVRVLAVAASTAGNNTSTQEINGAYAIVRQYILNRYAAAQLEALEKKPGSKIRQFVVQVKLERAGADKDLELLKLLRPLVEALKVQAPGGGRMLGADLERIKAAIDVRIWRARSAAEKLIQGATSEKAGAGDTGAILGLLAGLFVGKLKLIGKVPENTGVENQRKEFSKRTIDAQLLAPSLAAGQVATLIVTLCLLKSPVIGQFTGVALLSEEEDEPVNICLVTHGLTVTSEPPPPLSLVADRDSAPVAFQLHIEDTANRWLHVIVVQSGRVAGELVINNFDQLGGDTREVTAPMVRVQDADLTVIIHKESAIVSSPRDRASKFHVEIPGVKPLATPFRAMLQDRLKALTTRLRTRRQQTANLRSSESNWRVVSLRNLRSFCG